MSDMSEQEAAQAQLYKTVLESVRSEGFHSITIADVAERHQKMLMHKGSTSLDQIGRAIQRNLLKQIEAQDIRKTV